jgi:hypothetical protein
MTEDEDAAQGPVEDEAGGRQCHEGLDVQIEIEKW